MPVGLLPAESLSDPAVRWEHRVSAAGAATLTITTADGLRVHGADVGAVLNRLASPPLGILAAAAAEDRDYARNELAAFAASWLRALSATIVNRPDPHGLCGRWRRPLEWRTLATTAGMPCAPLALDSRDGADPAEQFELDDRAATTVLAVDGRVLHPGVPAALHGACARLTALAATRVLGLRFDRAALSRGAWLLLGATPYPDLTLAGETGVAAIEAALAA
jgi:hypothetical protein